MPQAKYQCQECNFKGNQLRQGKCPACGSASIINTLKTAKIEEKEAQPMRIFLLIVLWSVLLYKGYTEFILG